MKRYFLALLLIGLFSKLSFAVPNNTMSITPAAEDATPITASDENTRNSVSSTTYNAHSHTDITSLGTITTGVWNGTAVGAQYGGTGASSYTIGDLLYANTSTNLVKLGSVSIGNLLTTSGSTPVWTNLSNGVAQGSILYYSSSGVFQTLAPSTSGYFLKTQGAGANPAWSTVNITSKVGTFSRSVTSASGTYTVTGVGFNASALSVYSLAASTSGTEAVAYSLGFTDKTSPNNLLFYGTGAEKIGMSSGNNLIQILSSDGTAQQLANAPSGSFTSDGFVVDFTLTGSFAVAGNLITVWKADK